MSVTMREMLEAGVHFGHQTRFWNPKMAPYIYGHRNKIHIINLEKTLPAFEGALKFVRQLASKRGAILMVGTKRQARDVIASEAQRAGMPYVDQRWLGGMLTNFKTVKGSLKKLKDMQAQVEAGTQPAIKKEALMFQREIAKLEKDIGGIQDMNALPDAIFVIDVGYHKIAVAEAKKLGIPVIGVVDSNHSPEDIDYVIPGNDDSAKAVALYARAVADAVLEGKSNAVSEVVQAAAGGDEFVAVNGSTGALVEINCETDFVSKNDSFLAFAKSAAELVAQHNPADVAALSALPLSQDGFGPTVEDVRKGLIGKIGENLAIRRFKRYAGGGKLASYLHGTRIGVMVEFDGNEVAAKDVAMHVAAMKPVSLSSADVPAP